MKAGGGEEDTYAIGQIFRREYSTQAFFVIDDENAVSPFSRAQLAGLSDRDILWDGQRRCRLERGYRSFRSDGLSSLAAPLALGGRDRTLARQFGLNFLADGLRG